VSVVGFLTAVSIALRSLLEAFGLFDDQVAAHVFTTILLESFVEVFLARNFDEAETTGSASGTVSHEFHVRNSAESAEEILNILLRSVVAETTNLDFEFLVGFLGSGLLGRGLEHGFDGLGFLDGFFFRFFFFLFIRRFFFLGSLHRGLLLNDFFRGFFLRGFFFLGGSLFDRGFLLDDFFGRFFLRGRFNYSLLGRSSLLDWCFFNDFFGRFFLRGRFNHGLLGRSSFLDWRFFNDFFRRFFLRGRFDHGLLCRSSFLDRSLLFDDFFRRFFVGGRLDDGFLHSLLDGDFLLDGFVGGVGIATSVNLNVFLLFQICFCLGLDNFLRGAIIGGLNNFGLFSLDFF
jgi:hypothetical protein